MRALLRPQTAWRLLSVHRCTVRVGWLTSFVLAVGLVGVSCVGGQTGTEDAPNCEGVGGSTSVIVPSPTTMTGIATATGTTTDTSTAVGTGTNTSISEHGPCILGEPGAASVETGALPTFEELTAFVDAAGALQWVDDEGGSTAVTVTVSSNGLVCWSLGSDGLLREVFGVEAVVVAADESVQLAMNGEGVIQLGADGSPSSVELSLSRRCDVAMRLKSMDTCAWAEVEPRNYASVLVELQIRVQRVGERTRLLGSLITYGSSSVDCSLSTCTAMDWQLVKSVTLTSL